MECPTCKTVMSSGYLYSGFSVCWLHDSDGAAKKMLGLGQRLQGQGMFKATGEVIKGWHCAHCDSVLIQKVGLKPSA